MARHFSQNGAAGNGLNVASWLEQTRGRPKCAREPDASKLALGRSGTWLRLAEVLGWAGGLGGAADELGHPLG
jgi:hypothetical protein